MAKTIFQYSKVLNPDFDEGVITIGAMLSVDIVSSDINDFNVQHVARSSCTEGIVACELSSKSSFFLILNLSNLSIISFANEVDSSFSAKLIVCGLSATVNNADKLSFVKSNRFRGGSLKVIGDLPFPFA